MSDWNVQTDAPESEIRAFLDEYSPWRVLVRFNGRISSEEFSTFEPFNRRPLKKILTVAKHLPPAALGGSVLDVGFNCGYNSIYLSQKYGARTVGVEISPRHQKAASRLAAMCGVNAEFHVGSAETFVREGAFDLVLHFGTLYHLLNPMLALESAARNLKRGGWLALETTAYTGGTDQNESLWIHGFNGDFSNFWTLSKTTIEQMLGILGFADIKLVVETSPPIYRGRMSRVMYIARNDPTEKQRELMARLGLCEFHGRPGTTI
jgi:SAM-dependent methyltransferase